MRIFHTDEFCKNIKKLPVGVKKIYQKQEKIFSIDWQDSRLHTKKLKGSNTFSFRITLRYRVLFEFLDENSVVFITIGHRKNIYD